MSDKQSEKKYLFDAQYRFKGRHAERVDRLTSQFDGNGKAQLFNRNIDVYTTAPLVGFLYGRRADLDNTKNQETNQVYTENIFNDRVIGSQDELLFNLSLIMLLDKEYESDENKRIDKAFRHLGDDPLDMERFDSYVRGGVDVLYEKLIEGAEKPEDYILRLYEFLEEFRGRFNEEITADDIRKLCTKK